MWGAKHGCFATHQSKSAYPSLRTERKFDDCLNRRTIKLSAAGLLELRPGKRTCPRGLLAAPGSALSASLGKRAIVLASRGRAQEPDLGSFAVWRRLPRMGRFSLARRGVSGCAGNTCEIRHALQVNAWFLVKVTLMGQTASIFSLIFTRGLEEGALERRLRKE